MENRPLNILIVEDDDGFINLIRKNLQRCGYVVQIAMNGANALEQLQSDAIDLLLLDYKLPDITAQELVQQLGRQEHQVPFIIITGHGDERTAVEMMKLGARDYLLKDASFLDFLPNVVERAFKQIATEKQLTGAQEELKRSERQYRLLAENAADVIWTVSLNFRKLTYVSQSVTRLLGFLPEELLPIKPERCFTADSWKIVMDTVIESLKDIESASAELLGKKQWVLELEMTRKDGSTVWTEMKMTILHDSNEKAIGFLGVSRDISERKQSQEKLKESYFQLCGVLEDSIQAMGKAIEMKDPYTAGHQRRVSALACLIAQELGLDDEVINSIRLASSVHDIGKISIPSEILSKPGKLNVHEFNLIKTHSSVGYDILKTIDFPWPIAEIVVQHHERIDGSGYPDGIKGDEILIEAKIVSVADVVEAMTFHRPYRPSPGLGLAIEQISQNRGRLYDSKVVDACLKIVYEHGFKFE